MKAGIPVTGNNILLISPQLWGVMHVSKHHYAIELARMGNRVYFLGPPTVEHGPYVTVTPHDSVENLFLVSYRLFFPFNLRFHLRRIYDLLMRKQVRMLLKEIGDPLDIVWCFDTNLFSDLKVFGAKRAIYHIADQIMSQSGVSVAATADLVIAVDQSLLDKLDGVSVPKLVVGHGLAEPFALHAEKRLAEGIFEQSAGGPIQAGYVGNLLITSLDRKTFRQIVDAHEGVIFHFWGGYEIAGNNAGGGTTPDILDFVAYLKSRPNVVLHGAVETVRLAEEIQSMDVFLLCYDTRNDINGGCNSHKILEYLSTGKVVISSQMSAYGDHADLLCLVDGQDNSSLSRLFSETVQRLSIFNAPSQQRARLQLALMSRYSSQVAQIFEWLCGNET